MKQFVSQEESVQEKVIEDEEREVSEISDIIDKSDIEAEDKQRIIACIRKEEFKGPLPHPAILKQYEEIHPGFAEEIMKMAVKEQGHRHDMEEMIVKTQTSLTSGQLYVIRASIKLKSRLQIFGFISTVLLVIIGAICIFLDKNASSIAPFVLAIGSFCWTMFYGNKKQPEENDGDDDEADE